MHIFYAVPIKDIDNMYKPYMFLKCDKKIGKIGPKRPDLFSIFILNLVFLVA